MNNCSSIRIEQWLTRTISKIVLFFAWNSQHSFRASFQESFCSVILEIVVSLSNLVLSFWEFSYHCSVFCLEWMNFADVRSFIHWFMLFCSRFLMFVKISEHPQYYPPSLAFVNVCQDSFRAPTPLPPFPRLCECLSR